LSNPSSSSPSTPATQPGTTDSSAGAADGTREHPSIAAFRATLTEAGGTGRIVVLPASVHTAVLAAEALGCEVGAIANSLLFDADESPVLVLTSGAHRVDTAKVAAGLDVAKLRRATPEFVRTHTGQAIGGVAPLGHPKPVRTLVDTALEQYPVIWAAGGVPRAVFPITYAELLRVTAGSAADVA
jgi:prolyl-tRNA editing enzyme YbaK/EbsC (Cys-tRNA(Pro) deacylase)